MRKMDPFLRGFLAIALGLALTLIAVRCWGAEEVHWNSKADAPKWETSDTVLTGIAIGLMAWDWQTTVKNRANPHVTELNPALGKDFESGRADKYFGLTTAGLLAAVYFIPKWRPYILGGWITMEAAADINNARRGLRPWRK